MGRSNLAKRTFNKPNRIASIGKSGLARLKQSAPHMQPPTTPSACSSMLRWPRNQQHEPPPTHPGRKPPPPSTASSRATPSGAPTPQLRSTAALNMARRPQPPCFTLLIHIYPLSTGPVAASPHLTQQRVSLFAAAAYPEDDRRAGSKLAGAHGAI
ncbi:hypothetical protein BD779DRAFT_1577434 [Infundibulicybe gibba]|nr:hypothetical protein BD779DRAFT_1577434 [Infundibulicybe gibba]